MTAQIHEELLIDGEETSMAFCPPLPIGHPRIVALSGDEMDRLAREESWAIRDVLNSTACWRNYVGTWEIKEGRFYLVGLRGIYKLSGGESIFADWFTGALRIPKGEMLQYVHMGFGSVYEQELHVRITKGVIVRMRFIDNRGTTFDKWELGSRNLPGGENHFRYDTEARFFASLVVRCPFCLTPSDVPDPEKTHDLVGLCLASDSDYLLWECKCGGCKTIFEGVSWNSILVHPSELDGFDQRLPERYSEAVNYFASLKGEEKIIDRSHVEFRGSVDIEAESISFGDSQHFTEKQIIIPIKALTLAHGIRKAAIHTPGTFFGCTIGPLDLIVSLDQDVNTYNPNYPHAMHLRVSDHITGVPITGSTLEFGISLVFGYQGFDFWPWFHGIQQTQCRSNNEWAQVHIPWQLKGDEPNEGTIR